MTKDEMGAALIAALIAAGWALYRLSRVVKADRTSDQLDAKGRDAIDRWQGIAERAEERADRAQLTIERVAKERNDAVQLVGKLEAQVGHLTEEVEELRQENGRLMATLQDQSEMLRGMKQVNDHILAQLSALSPSKVVELRKA